MAGTMPKETRSARESRLAPKSPSAPLRRAMKPSSESNNAARITKASTRRRSLETATTPRNPAARLPLVMAFGQVTSSRIAGHLRPVARQRRDAGPYPITGGHQHLDTVTGQQDVGPGSEMDEAHPLSGGNVVA